MSSGPEPVPNVDPVEVVQDELELPVDGYLRLQELLREDSVQGALRRALDSIEGLDFDLARYASIEPKHLRDFYWGDAELKGEEIDRLARVLHLQLKPTDR